MYCNQIFSLINEGTIQNIIVADNYEIANQIARSIYGSGAIAVDTTLYPVGIGDSYADGIFTRDGVEIPRNPTEAEQITAQQDSIAELTTLNADILYDVCLLQLGNN